MFRQSVVVLEPVSLTDSDKRICAWIVTWIVIQCILVFVGAATIDFCLWSPEHSTHDYDKLARIMYLYDPRACDYNLRSSRSIWNLRFNNDTQGLNVRPIEWMPAVVTVSTRLSSKTRKYVRFSVIFHNIWMLMAILLGIFRSMKKLRFLKLILTATFYSSVFIVSFDVSMAIVYIAHIQQSLTRGMILRYSGWSVEMKIKKYDHFGGWFPIIASICWMKGVIVLAMNIYCCRILYLIRRRIRKREVKTRIILEKNIPIPEPKYDEPIDDKVLYFRTGEYKPLAKKSYKSMFFF